MSEQPMQPQPEPGAKLTDHSYDGIQEYDNPTPGWWTWIFVATIVFAVAYFVVMLNHGESLGVKGTYDAAVADSMARQFSQLGQLEPDAPTLIRFATDPKEQPWLTFGRAVFQTNCASCHGRSAEGLSGPNLTDDAYIHIRKIEDIVTVVTKGANNGAMPAWGNRLQENEVVLVSAYIASLRGTNAPGLGAQGQVIPAWTTQ